MKKIITLLAIFALSVALNAFDFNGKVLIKIPQQDEVKSGYLKIPAMDLKVGESGIITRLVENNEFILANTIVSEINEGVATIAYIPFKNIMQEYMPTPIGMPTEGDRAIFRILYKRAVIVAPNQNIYQTIIESHPKFNFVSADILASYLANNDINMPRGEHFRGFCDKFNIGLIFLATNRLNVLDCQSFRILESKNLDSKDLSQNKPFFTRYSQITLGELFDTKKFAADYFAYYASLIGQNPQLSTQN